MSIFRIFLIFTVLLTFPVNIFGKSLSNFLKDQFKIEHPFSRPNTNYMPGTLLLYTKNSGYTNLCIAEWIKDSGSYSTQEGPLQITEASEQKDEDYKIELTAADLANLDGQYSQISSVELKLTNGRQIDVSQNLGRVLEKINSPAGNCYDTVLASKASHPNARIIYAKVSYKYDFEYVLRNQSNTKLNLALSKKLLSVINAKMGISISNNATNSSKGTGLYVGFNGNDMGIVQEDMSVVFQKKPSSFGCSSAGLKKINNLNTMVPSNSGGEVGSFDLTKQVGKKPN